ncbi:MAG: TauD/TfdA family dioxygenase [Chromatiales bacterium]|nr:TauD/TfdA family dioxygenase [Chromatiales bacterium]
MTTAVSALTFPDNNPFNPADDHAYQQWRIEKLDNYPSSLDQLVVPVENLLQLSTEEYAAISARLNKTNMAIYASCAEATKDKELIRAMGQQFGLNRLDHNMCADNDAITSLTVQEDALHQGYIPYSTRPIAWHTDGYYNDHDHQIRGLLLHCVQPAASGGANQLMDHELMYLLLRDQDPRFIEALMHPEAMTIPANVEDGKELRPDRTGPVFRVYTDGSLHMRYTDRNRSIEWRDDTLTQEAVAALKELLSSATQYQFEGTLQPGQGLVSRNVLHTRSRFEDGEQQRLLYRARYFDSITISPTN